MKRQMRGAGEEEEENKKDHGEETKVSNDERRQRKRKLVTNCECALAALSDRPIILLAHLEAKPG